VETLLFGVQFRGLLRTLALVCSFNSFGYGLDDQQN